MKSFMRPANLILALALAVAGTSCKKSDTADLAPATESHDIASLQQAVAQSLGTDPASVVYQKELQQFVVEEDSYVTLEDAVRRFAHHGVTSGVQAATHQQHYYLIKPEKVNAITLYADTTVPAAWLTVLDSAIASWNAAGSRVRLQRVNSPTGATTKVTTNYSVSSTIASAAYPDYYGNPGNRVTINTYHNGMTVAKKRFALTHELGHSIGLAHTNSTWGSLIEGTPTTDAQSIMNASVLNWSQFTAFDLLAVRTLYPQPEPATGVTQATDTTKAAETTKVTETTQVTDTTKATEAKKTETLPAPPPSIRDFRQNFRVEKKASKGLFRKNTAAGTASTGK
ncbi:M57 family metalloprotease [Paraflavisolibacter sp. H34]|uniref:M57 family metalloprotease n=1 Tax=Huijunlia imazamoxiresistens TaxID=3127457 RepID=UPI0030191D48